MNNKRLRVIGVILLVWLILISKILSACIRDEAMYATERLRNDAEFNELDLEDDFENLSEEFLNSIEEYNSEKSEEYKNRSVTTLPGVELTDKQSYNNEEDATTLAKLLYGECRGIPSRAEKEAVVWCVLNRVDNSRFPDTVYEVVTAKGQFDGYNVNNPIWEELFDISQSVLNEWNKEKNGEGCIRSLPSDYFFFHGDGVHNWFRKEYKDKSYYKF